MDIRRRNIMALMCAGASGSVLKPADQDAIAQWLYDLDPDGITFLDYKATVDYPVVTGVNCLELDGTSGVIVLSSSCLSSGNDFDISMLFASTEARTFRKLLSKANGASDRTIFVYYQAGEIRVDLSSDGTTWTSSTTASGATFNDGTFNTLRVTKTGTALTIKQNGTTVGSATVTDTIHNSSIPVTVSGENGSASGVIAATFSTFDLDGRGYYPLQEGEGTTAGDVSGNGNDGTISGGAIWVQDTTGELPTHNGQWGYTPFGTAGHTPALKEKTLSVATFDGAGDYVVATGVNHTFGASWRIDVELSSAALSVAGRPLSCVEGSDVVQLATGSGNQLAWFFRDAEGNVASSTAIYAPADRLVRHLYTATRAGDSIFTYIDGELIEVLDSSDLGNIEISDYWIGAKTGGSAHLNGVVYSINIDDTAEYDFTRYFGKSTGTIIDESGNGNEGTVATPTSDDFWGTRFADASGSYVDSDYNLLGVAGTSLLGGGVHNGGEFDHIQTDSAYAAFGNGTTIYGDGSTTWNNVSYADYVAHLNFNLGLVLQWRKDWIGTLAKCILWQTAQRAFDYGWTPANYLKDGKWSGKYTNECGAGALVPAEVTAGTGIGPGGTWTDNGDGKILMVEVV